jgi:HK97 family phage major capsid protein
VARGTTTLGAVPYIKESSFANAATTVAENGEKPEATFATEEVIAPVKKIAVVGRVSDELFADYPAMQSYVDGRLRYMVAAKEEDQILNGNGTGSNLTGILNTSGVLFQNSATGTLIDNIHQAITKVRAEGFFEPDAIVIHPNDWQSLRLAKDNDDQYYSQGPFAQIGGNSIWGLPAVITTAIAEGTQLVGAFRLGAQLFYKNGVTVEASNSDGDDFTYNRMAIRVEERVALAVFRPTAFCAIYAD